MQQNITIICDKEYMKIKNIGFTLIELMIVIALIAMLAGFALPSYQRYLQRAQIAEGFTLATPIQMAVNEMFYETGAVPTTLTALGIPAPQGRYIQQLEIHEGAIVITYGNQANTQLANKTLRLIPYMHSDQSLIWRCQIGSLPAQTQLAPGAHDEPLSSDLSPEFLPQTCRANNE